MYYLLLLLLRRYCSLVFLFFVLAQYSMWAFSTIVMRLTSTSSFPKGLNISLQMTNGRCGRAREPITAIKIIPCN
ncbi:uncharacterized protein PHALS_15310 [Plasmopara halstedii]|uniref:Uncharacterized protein n=1 Tax=Plasmopara halstedii TaxID=4781 RepID=A0A0P1ATE4_PLAHL|nr:uncharacterized protein PHALS_15310 [Plasmopara halstedii]CEG44546.1 hypothetical protein PHALS_15310 [Plasmopara halstedii]|eukprot:XP_024580915.1 hypothetical protein PHALS_15310 [Plasmopara halstedii]